MTILMFAIGTAGDVLPTIAVGRELRNRGHSVQFVANSYFEDAVGRAGLHFISSGSAEHYLATIANPDLWRFGKGFRILVAEILAQMRPAYELIVSRYRAGETLVVAPSAAFGARIANEKLGVPLVHLHLSPIIFRSRYQQPGLNLPSLITPLVRPLRSAMLWALDRWILDPALLPATNSFRAELGLAPLHRPFDGWIHSPERVIGLFPEWFAPPQPDWPPQLRLAGFVLYDEGEIREPPPELLDFLGSGEPPLVFALGTGMRFAKTFFSVSAEVCRQLGRRGVLLSSFREQLPDSLPSGVKHFGYVPFSALLPRSAAFVHHGGAGTMAQAFRSGVPQLAVPFNFDQPDNAARLKRIGAGDLIRPPQYQPAKVCRKLEAILSSAAIRARCREIAQHFTGVDAIGETCDLIEATGPRAQRARASERTDARA
jgi:UDP:flavonoid glycosyltransferase YjiC (YdhE family)